MISFGVMLSQSTGFSLDCLDMVGFVPPIRGGQVQGNKALMGEGPNFDRLYHKLKVLLLLLILL